MNNLVVALVEDHAVLCEILLEYIRNLPQVKSCTSAMSAEQALDQLSEAAPDLIFVDLSLPGMSGIELIAELRKQYPALLCGILSGHNSRSYSRQAIAAGANAYILKGDPGEIERGLAAMLAGRLYVSQGLDTAH